MLWIKEKMKVWVRADVLAKDICDRVRRFPSSSWGKHSISDQMSGSAGSIPDNPVGISGEMYRRGVSWD